MVSSLVYDFLGHFWGVTQMLKMRKALSALHQFAVLIRVRFCCYNKETSKYKSYKEQKN